MKIIDYNYILTSLIHEEIDHEHVVGNEVEEAKNISVKVELL
jgi:hypothetical protein